MFDDMISTAGSICKAAILVKSKGAKEIHVAASHGVFAGDAFKKLREAPIDSIVVTDSIPVPEEKRLPNMKILPIGGFLAEAIMRIHQNKSISTMFTSTPDDDRA